MSISTPRKTGITLAEYNKRYRDPTDPLYVINNVTNRGRIAFSVMGDMNTPVTVVVPNTFIPIDLTVYATRSSLMVSSQLRQLLSANNLVIIDNQDALEMMESSRYQAEYKRVFDAEYSAGEVSINLNETNTGPKHSIDDEIKTETTPSLRPLVSDIIERSNEQDADSVAITNSLLVNWDSLTEDEVQAIIGATTNSEVKDFCLEMLTSEEK